MKAATKTILFSRVTVGKAVKQHPVAVFGRETDAKAYASLIDIAHKTGNAEMAKQLDERTEFAEDGSPHPGVRFALVTVPYAPTLAASSDELFAPESSATS